jgi:hypothetical protein
MPKTFREYRPGSIFEPGDDPPAITFSKRALSDALDRIVVDERFRKKLNNHPIEALKEIGVTIDPETAKKFAGKKLQETFYFDPSGGTMTAVVSVAPYVWVAVMVKVLNGAKANPDEVILPEDKRRTIERIHKEIKSQVAVWQAQE